MVIFSNLGRPVGLFILNFLADRVAKAIKEGKKSIPGWDGLSTYMLLRESGATASYTSLICVVVKGTGFSRA
jgi:hypothetical protein